MRRKSLRSGLTIWGMHFCLLFLLPATQLVARQGRNIPLSTAIGDQTSPKMLPAEAPESIVSFWLDDRSGKKAIYGQSLAEDGFPLFENGRLMIERSVPVTHFDIAPGENGSVFVIWQEHSGSTTSAFVQRINAEGALEWDAPVRIGDPGKLQTNPRITTDDEGGVYLIWEEHATPSPGDDTFIYVQRIDDSGAALWETPGVKAVHANVALGDVLTLRKGLVIAWENLGDGKVYLRAFDRKDGKSLTDAGFKPSGSIFTMTRPRLEYQDFDDSLEKARVYIVWQENRLLGNVNIYAQLIFLSGEKDWRNNGVAVTSEPGAQTNHEIISDGDNGFVAVWQNGGAGESKIYAQRVSDKAKMRWKDSGVLVAESKGGQTNPRISSNHNKGVYCVWQDDRNGTIDLYAQEISKSGKREWDDAGVAIAEQAGAQISAMPLTLADERIGFLWQDMRDGNADIYAQLVLPEGELDNVPPRIISTPITAAAVGQKYSYTLAALDVDQDEPYLFALESKIDWLTIDPGSGVLSGVPPAEATHKVAVSVIDARDARGEQSFEITVAAGQNTPPKITSTPVISIDEDAEYVYQIVVEDPDSSDSHSFSAISLPDWLTLDSATGLLAGTPLNAHVGRHDLTVIVLDRAGAQDRQAFSIDVVNTNDPPIIVTENFPASTLEDQSFAFTVEASDPDIGDRLTFLLLKNPPWLSIDGSSGQLAGTPGNDDVGESTVTVRVRDATGAGADASFKLQVQNVNDPPIFTSSPTLEAFVEVQYNYTVSAEDIDLGDQLAITLKNAPSWLHWNSAAWQLNGAPPANAAGRVDSVKLTLSDLAGAKVTQAFAITIKGSGEPDVVAPDPPADAGFSTAGWTNAAQITLRWTTPTDQSGIASAFIKISDPPADENDFDVEHAVTKSAGEIDSVTFSVTLEGEVPVYLWFKDRQNNVDFAKAAMVRYRLDRTQPGAPTPIKPNAFSRSDTVKFVWKSANDDGSGVARYEITVDGHFQSAVTPAVLGGDTLFAELPLFLSGKLFSWRVTAFDSAGNQSASASATFDLDDAKPIIIHPTMESAPLNTVLTLEAEIFDKFSGIDAVEIRYRTAGTNEVSVQKMSRQAGGDNLFRAVIAKNEIEARGLEYNIFAVDGAGNRQSLQTNPLISSYISLPIASDRVDAPQQTFENRYQMIGVPYDAPAKTVRQIFEDSFGGYKNSEWRLLRYLLDGSYAELTIDDFGEMRPGQAFWLITQKTRSLRVKDVVSVRTDEIYDVTMATGWNMIASPFAFDIDLGAQTFSDGAAVIAWAYDGSGYKMETEKLAAWQGYFVENTSGQSQTLRLIPRPAAALLQKKKDFWRGKQSVLQISAELNGFTDEFNFFGVNFSENEVLAINEISEPPAISQSPRIYFLKAGVDRALATAFKRGGAQDLSWELAAANLSFGKLNLQLSLIKAFSDSFDVLITDKNSGAPRRLPLEGETSFFIGEGETERHFSLSLIPRNEPRFSAAPPSAFRLRQPRPNPYRRSSGGQIVIYFTLDQSVDIQVSVFDLLGREVWRSGNFGAMPRGEHAVLWDARDLNREQVASGVYFVALSVNGVPKARRKVLILQ